MTAPGHAAADMEAGLPGLADNERMPLLVREAFKGAMSDTLPALQSGAKAAILDAAKQQDEAARAKVKKEKRETGVHPRDLILPSLVLLIMSVPVLVIYLPVFVAAAQDYERSSQHIDYVCAITNVPEKVQRAWSNVQKVDLSVKNATAFKDRLLARTGNTEAIQRVQAAQAVPLPRAAPAVQEYMEYQHCACSQIASLVFDDASSWTCKAGPDPSVNSRDSYPSLIDTFLDSLGDKFMPPPAPAPPPSPLRPPYPPGQVPPSPSPGSEDYDYGSYDDALQAQQQWDEILALLEYLSSIASLGDEPSPPQPPGAPSPSPPTSPTSLSSGSPTSPISPISPASTTSPPTSATSPASVTSPAAPASNTSSNSQGGQRRQRRRLSQQSPTPTGATPNATPDATPRNPLKANLDNIFASASDSSGQGSQRRQRRRLSQQAPTRTGATPDANPDATPQNSLKANLENIFASLSDTSGQGSGRGLRRRLTQQAPTPPGATPDTTPDATPRSLPKANPDDIFDRMTYNGTGGRPSTDQRIVGYMGLKAAVSKVDAQAGTMSLAIQAKPFSIYQYPYGIIDRKKVNAELPKGVVIATTVLSSASNAAVRHVGGDSVRTMAADISLATLRSLYWYPFDVYEGTIEIESITSDFNASATRQGPRYWRTALLVRQRNLAVGWDVTVTELAHPYDAFISVVSNYDDGAGFVRYVVRLERTGFVKFFAVITTIFMWILGSFAILYAIDAMYLRPRPVVIAEATMFFGAIFSYGAMRNLMPDVPRVGVGVDFLGYIWIVLMLMGTCALVYCRMVAQYVHNQPTLYDRAFNRQYYQEWDAEQRKKKAEEAAKNLAQKQEAAAKNVAAAAAGAQNGCHEGGTSKVEGLGSTRQPSGIGALCICLSPKSRSP